MVEKASTSAREKPERLPSLELDLKGWSRTFQVGEGEKHIGRRGNSMSKEVGRLGL